MNTNETNNVIERELSDAELDAVAGGFNMMTIVLAKALAERQGTTPRAESI
jgi:hypothetical protein